MALVLLAASTSFAGPVYPVSRESADKFPLEGRQAIDAIWDTLHLVSGRPGALRSEFNSQECRVFEAYTSSILKTLIQRSQLQSETHDLLFYMDCYNLSRFPLGAKLRSRTLELNQGYMGSLKSEDEIAAVLAHELSHHIQRHEDRLQAIAPKKKEEAEPVDMLAPQKVDEETLRTYKAMQKFEDEADLNSVAILANAGYSYVGAIDLLNNVGRGLFNSSPRHSTIPERIAMIEDRAQSLKLRAKPVRPVPSEVKSAVERYFNATGEREQTTWLPMGSGRLPVDTSVP